MPEQIKYLVEDNKNEIDIFLILRIVKKNFILVAVLFFIFLILGASYVFTRPAEYYTSFPIVINQNVSSSVLNDLNNASKFSDSDLIKNVSLSQEEVDNLNFIQISNIVLGERKHKAVINVNTKDPKYLESITTNLINWSSNNPTLIKTIKNKKSKLQSLISKADEQLLDIKTLKEKVLNNTNRLDNNSIAQVSFTGEFIIYETKEKLSEELENLKAIYLDSQIYIPSEAKNSSKIIPLFFVITFSLLLSLISVIVFRFNHSD